jgi:hypothetical protein
VDGTLSLNISASSKSYLKWLKHMNVGIMQVCSVNGKTRGEKSRDTVPCNM